MQRLLALMLVPILATGPLAAVIAQAVERASGSDVAPWLTATAVVTVTGLFYKFLVNQIQRLQAKCDALEQEIRDRNKDDRETLIPALMRNTEVLAGIVSTQSGKSE